MTQQTIKDVQNKDKSKVTAVVTENAKKMETMCQKLHEDDPSLHVHRCSSLWLILLGGDLTPSADTAHVVVEKSTSEITISNQHC